MTDDGRRQTQTQHFRPHYLKYIFYRYIADTYLLEKGLQLLSLKNIKSNIIVTFLNTFVVYLICTNSDDTFTLHIGQRVISLYLDVCNPWLMKIVQYFKHTLNSSAILVCDADISLFMQNISKTDHSVLSNFSDLCILIIFIVIISSITKLSTQYQISKMCGNFEKVLHLDNFHYFHVFIVGLMAYSVPSRSIIFRSYRDVTIAVTAVLYKVVRGVMFRTVWAVVLALLKQLLNIFS